MKKLHKALIIIGIIILALFLMSTTASAPSTGAVKVTSEVIYTDGMTYRVFKGKSTYDNHIDIEVINVTKEKLEIEKLKAEINYYKKLK
jgi:hypothetical protein